MSKSHTHSIRSSRSLSDFGITPHNNILKTKTAKVKKFLIDLATTTGKVDLNGVKQALAHNGVILTNQQEFLELAQTMKQRIKVEVIMEWIKFGKPNGNKDQITATFEAPKNMNALLSDNLSQSSFTSQNKIPRPPSRSISQQRSIASALGRRVSTPVINLNESIEQADNRSEKSLVLSTKPIRPANQTGAQRPVSAVLSRRSNQNQDDNISRSTVKNFRPVKKSTIEQQQKTMGQRAFSNLLDKTFHSTKEPTKPKEERINTQYSSNNRIRTLDRNSTVNSSFSDTSSRDASFDRKLIDTINDEEDEPRLVPNILVYKPSRPLTKGTGTYEELVVELIHDLQKKTVEYEFMFRMLKILMKQTHKYNTKRIFRDVYEVEANALKPVLGPELYTRIIDLSTNKEGKVSLKLMASLVDKYKHAPHYVTEFKNSSHRFQEIALFGSKIQGKVRKVHENCQLLSRRIEEKFKKMGKAYRFFDLDKTGYVTFPSFKHGLDLLGLRLSEEEAKELFTYLDGKKDGILDHDEFCDILEERRLMKKVKANHDLSSTTQSTATDQQMSRSSKDSPFLTFITTNLKSQPKFIDFRKESSSDIYSTSYISSAHIKQLKKNPTLRRKFSLVGSATKSNASLPSDTDDKFKYGVKSKATESMKDIMANNYQREWIEKAQEKEQRRIDAEKERRSCPKRWTTDASMLRGAFVSSMIARKKKGDSMWKMTKFSNVQPKVNSYANAIGSRRGSAGNNATMLDCSMSQSSFHLENPRDLNISVL